MFDDFFVQDMRLRKDGGFGAEIESLGHSPDWQNFDRWNYLQYFTGQVASNFVFYDPYEHDHYYPWKTWKGGNGNYGGVSFHSENTMMLSFNEDGVVEYIIKNLTKLRLFNGAGRSEYYFRLDRST